MMKLSLPPRLLLAIALANDVSMNWSEFRLVPIAKSDTVLPSLLQQRKMLP